MILLPTLESYTVDAIAYNRASDALRREFASLQHRVYPEHESKPDAADAPLHDPVFDCLSFYICAKGRVVSYAAVAMKTITHVGETFEIAGLSCVMTDPAHQGRGLGLRTVAAASRFMKRSNLDFGIFTCDPPLAGFYAQAGEWQIMPNVVLVGGHHEDALRSDSLKKVVLMRLFSDKAVAAAAALANTTINLDLPPGQFL